MGNIKVVDQKNWVRGVISSSNDLSQLPGAIPRISNMLLNQRGSLKTCDGSLLVSSFNNAGATTGRGAWTAIFLYQPVAADRFYVGVQKDPTTHLGAPAGLAAADGGAGGTLNGTFFYVVTGTDGAGGETLVSNEVSIAVTNHKVNLTWTALANATGYNVYRGTLGAETKLIAVTTNAYTDDNTAVALGGVKPVADTTQVCQFFKIPTAGYSAGTVLHTFPADAIFEVDGTPGGYGGDPSNPPAPSSGGGNTPLGGVSGNLSPLPQLFQFANKVILCLGNGFAPWVSDGTSGGTVALTNTFVASYPAWTASTTQNLGDVILPTAPNGHIFKCVQAGKTGGVQPTWTTVTNQAFADGSVVWKESGTDSAGTVPPGAAHGIVHAGALWVANTFASNNANGLDGPSAIRMSDINNPNSWNPVNSAFIGKDDGTQITGLSSFTIAESGITPTGSLVVFKEFSTYQITGVFGSANFSIQQAQTDLGCIAPRSIQYLPGFGIARLTHLGVAIFDGTRDRIISEEIRPYLFGGVSDIASIDWNFAYFSKGAQTAVPPTYTLAIPVIGAGASGGLTRILSYDLVLKAWSVIDLPWAIGSLIQARAQGTIPITVTGGFTDGTVRRLQAGDITFDGSPVTWNFRTPEVFAGSPTDRVYFRRLIIRGVVTSSTTASISVTVNLNGASQPAVVSREYDFGLGQFECIVDIGQTALNANATITGSTGVVQVDAVDWHCVPKPSGAFPRAS